MAMSLRSRVRPGFFSASAVDGPQSISRTERDFALLGMIASFNPCFAALFFVAVGAGLIRIFVLRSQTWDFRGSLELAPGALGRFLGLSLSHGQ